MGPGAGGGGGAGASGEEAKSRPNHIKAYLLQLKEQLPGEKYQAVVAALKRYRSDSDREALVGAVVAALAAPQAAHLLPGLARFLPKGDRAPYSERIRRALCCAVLRCAALCTAALCCAC